MTKFWHTCKWIPMSVPWLAICCGERQWICLSNTSLLSFRVNEQGLQIFSSSCALLCVFPQPIGLALKNSFKNIFLWQRYEFILWFLNWLKLDTNMHLVLMGDIYIIEFKMYEASSFIYFIFKDVWFWSHVLTSSFQLQTFHVQRYFFLLALITFFKQNTIKFYTCWIDFFYAFLCCWTKIFV